MTEDGSLHLAFASRPGGRFEVAFDGPPPTIRVEGGRATEQANTPAGSSVLIIEADRPEVVVSLLGS